jgi:hypothetical protein
MGRFLSPDWSAKEEPVPYAKLDDPQSLNLYVYVYNNPLTRVDADGHCPWCVGALVGATIGGGIETYKEYRAGKGFDGWKIAGEALKGGVTGAVAVATGGASILMQGAAVGAANVATGMAVRGTLNAAKLGKNPSVHALDKKAIKSDALAGAAGGLAGGAVGGAASTASNAASTVASEAANAANERAQHHDH